MKLLKKMFLCLMIPLLLWGCMPSMKKPQAIFVDPAFTAPMKVAVLPFENESVDVEADAVYRELFYLGLQEKGYTVAPMEDVDAALKGMGISEGGQLGAYKKTDLQTKLNVDALFFGNLKEAKYLTVGIKKEKKAVTYAALYNGDKKLWEDEKTFSEKEFALNPLSGLKKQLATKLTEKALKDYSGHPFYNHIQNCVYQLQDTLPGQRVEKSGW